MAQGHNKRKVSAASFGLKSKIVDDSKGQATKALLVAPTISSSGNHKTRHTTISHNDDTPDRIYTLKSKSSRSNLSKNGSPNFLDHSKERANYAPDYETISPQSKNTKSGLSTYKVPSKNPGKGGYMNVLEPESEDEKSAKLKAQNEFEEKRLTTDPEITPPGNNNFNPPLESSFGKKGYKSSNTASVIGTPSSKSVSTKSQNKEKK